MTDAEIDEILNELSRIGADFEPYGGGLPMWSDPEVESMRAVVRAAYERKLEELRKAMEDPNRAVFFPPPTT